LSSAGFTARHRDHECAEGISFGTEVVSDCAPLNELARSAGVGVELVEPDLPTPIGEQLPRIC